MSGLSSPLDELLSVLEGRDGVGNGNSQFQSRLHSGNEDPLLDSALAILGFTSTAVQQTLSTVSGKTLITVLSSSIASASKSYFGRLESAVLSSNASTNSCFFGTTTSQHEKPLDDEHMCFGTPFSISRTRKVMGEALSFLKGSKIEDRLKLDLVEVLVKVYCMTSSYKSRLVGSCLLFEREEEQEETLAVTFFDELVNVSLEKKELIYNQFSPSIRGAPCIWELKIEIGILIRDVLEHPTSWDLSLNVGISLSSLSAFYSGTLQSLAMMLMRPPSWDGLRELGDLLENKVSQGAGRSVLRGLGGMETADRDLATHLESLWILLMDFPAWILFALLSLFQKPRISGESYGKGVGAGISDSQSDPSGEKHVAWLSHQETAAQYIAWLFGPKDEKLRGLVVQMLMQVVQGWLHIKDEEIFRPVVKRRRLTTACSEGSCHAREEQKFVEEISVPEGLEGELRKKISRDHPDSLKGAYVAVQTWLLSFQDCCHILGDYSHGKTTAAIENKQQAKRRLVLRDMGGEATTVHDSQQSEAMCLQCKSFTFFDDLPLIALSCSPFLHSNVIVHLILHSVMVGSGFLSSKKDDYQAGRKGLAFKEPSHRTEDFRDACQEPFCLSFSHHASALKASGVSRVFRFLETLDLLEFSSFVNGSQGLGWLDSFKDAVARQLQMCMRSWSQHTSNTYSFALLDDLQQRASLWAARTGLESKTLKAFKQALQGLDIVIASSVVDDTF